MKSMMMDKTIVGVAVAAMVLSAVSSKAQLNLTGGTVVGSLTGQELTGVSPASNTGVNDGSISTWVVNDPTLDSQGLIFIYQAVNNGPDAVDNAEFTGFVSSEVTGTGSYATETGLALTGSFTPSGGNFSGEDTFGGTATFEDGDLNTGQTASDFLVVETDTHAFAGSYGQIEDDFSAAGNTLAPVAVPEASTVISGALMLLPLGIGAGRVLGKRNAARFQVV
jgi:hypothetical protein